MFGIPALDLHSCRRRRALFRRGQAAEFAAARNKTYRSPQIRPAARVSISCCCVRRSGACPAHRRPRSCPASGAAGSPCRSAAAAPTIACAGAITNMRSMYQRSYSPDSMLGPLERVGAQIERAGARAAASSGSCQTRKAVRAAAPGRRSSTGRSGGRRDRRRRSSRRTPGACPALPASRSCWS